MVKNIIHMHQKRIIRKTGCIVCCPNADCTGHAFGYNQGFKGVTDPSVNAQKNRDLSLQRASAVSSYLLGKGIGSQRITKVEGLGQDMPVADNSTKAGQQQNRRVEVYLYASKAMIDAANAGTLQ